MADINKDAIGVMIGRIGCAAAIIAVTLLILLSL